MKIALTIAGSDSGGGAGIQADLKTFAALGVYGTSVITSVTAQNTQGVQGVQDLPAPFVALQLDSVLSDLDVAALKTGMLSNRKIIEAVAAKIRQYRLKCLVVDPVMAAKSGDPLLQPEARETLIRLLLPLATIITPNLPETEILANRKVATIADMEAAARSIHEGSGCAVVVKGGHLEGEAIDIYFDGNRIIHFRGDRIPSKNTHGTGCTFSAAIAAFLARGLDLAQSVRRAKEFTAGAIRSAFPVGKGIGPTHHLFDLYSYRDRWEVMENLEQAVKLLEQSRIGGLIPEVQSNLGMALPRAISPEEVAAFPGRLIRWEDTFRRLSPPAFGGSRHIARIILTAMRHDPEMRAAMNIRYSPDIVEACQKLGLSVVPFDRQEEPAALKEREGASLEWGVQRGIDTLGKVPEIIWDRGDFGKEAMVRVLGGTAQEVAQVVVKIQKVLMEKRS
ncbi:MAG: bifunctional hydroxymethylpyrimidine kinase/phosphomethylpyrimidine kinase [Candidatus Tectomicrobia bacterium]|uniref:hydroxymethylpyrimidine kinase n=1 Tax=Tectimicrobiota bacterium TaxID=2528274 RepID=A0A932GM10_UNCTE|nr:bifunctional hydroxymethylpyrimidine kinase/phosphomethylpyrimidine kinase [Candidatus Tectomicrobia bacterium]